MEFWNKVLAVTLLYGGVTTLAAIEADRATGAMPFLRQLDYGGLLVVILAGGSVGVQLLRKQLAEASQWIPAQRFVVALTAILAVASSAAGSLPLVVVCVMALGMHAVVPLLLHD